MFLFDTSATLLQELGVLTKMIGTIFVETMLLCSSQALAFAFLDRTVQVNAATWMYSIFTKVICYNII